MRGGSRRAGSTRGRRTSELLDVARATLGVHAQLMTGAELALSARVDGVTRDEVRELLWERRALVKGNTIRGTLHLHPADDFALWKSLRSARWREQKWLDWQELTLARRRVPAGGGARRARRAADARGDRRRDRRHASATASRATRGATCSRRPANELCHGPPRGRNVTFVRCDRWIPGWQLRDRDDALRELVRRYVETYGPVRRDELEHWFAFKLPADALDGWRRSTSRACARYVLPGRSSRTRSRPACGCSRTTTST